MILRIWVLSLLSCTFAMLPSMAQIMTGSIGGTITEQSGSVVGDASVGLVQVSTGITRHSTTDSAGNFLFGGLDGGEYMLTASKPGFKTLEQKGIILSTGDRISLEHVALELGTVSDTVSVTADAASVQTASSDRSDVITGKQIENILVQGRKLTWCNFCRASI